VKVRRGRGSVRSGRRDGRSGGERSGGERRGKSRRVLRPDSGPSDSSDSEESETSEASDESDDEVEEDDDDMYLTSDDSDEEDEPGGSRHTSGGRHDRDGQRVRRPTPGELDRRMKDLEISSYVPSPSMAVSTWIDMVNMRLQGAESSQRGGWTDKDLYFILGNKLKESAAEWHVELHRQLERRGHEHRMTWTYLKKQLLLRFGERLNRAQAEGRVRERFKFDAEGYMTYASQLRRLVGRNHVREQTLLDQFYKQLSPGVLESVKRKRPLPKTVEGAARRASRYDPYEGERVAAAMRRLGQRWSETPPAYRTNRGEDSIPLIPGVSARQAEAIRQRVDEIADGSETVEGEKLPVITNQGGVFNPITALWEVPPNFEYSGGAWAPRKRSQHQSRKRSNSSARSDEGKRRREEGDRRSVKRAKVSKAAGKQEREEASSSDMEDSEEGELVESVARRAGKTARHGTVAARTQLARPSKALSSSDADRQSTLIQQAVAAALREKENERAASESVRRGWKCFTCGEEGHLAGSCPKGLKCYACQRVGHFARDCPDAVKRERNNEYLKARADRELSAEQPGNGDRA